MLNVHARDVITGISKDFIAMEFHRYIFAFERGFC